MRNKLIVGGIGFALLLGACTGAEQSFNERAATPSTAVSEPQPLAASAAVEEEATLDATTEPLDASFPTVPTEVRVIRDGRIDVRIGPGDFGRVSAELRTIAEDFGGYISSGETHLEEIEGEVYTVGWFTLRIPEIRFEDALARAEGLGDRLALNVSSEDVSEEYVDLEGRLTYWKSQEAFYLRLMDETERVDQLVTLQNQMRQVLLEIERLEGRIRYLDSRTQFSTLTVGLTEVPATTPVPVEEPPTEPGILMEALDQAGTVLLSVVGFLIVAASFALPLAIVALLAYGVWRAFGGGRRRKDPELTEA